MRSKPAGNAWRGSATLTSANGGLRNSARSRRDLVGYRDLKLDATFDPQRIEVRLGAVRMTAHFTPGHTRGCTSWTLPVRVDGRTRQALFICGASAPGYRLVGNPAYPWIMDDFRRSFATWRTLPCALFLGAHASYFGMAAKRARMAPGRPNPFVDPKGCRAFLAKAEQNIRAQAAKDAKKGE